MREGRSLGRRSSKRFFGFGTRVFDFLSIFLRRRPGKPRKRKSSGSWRVELEKIGGLVGKSPAKRTASTPPPVLQPPAPESLQIEPLRDDLLVRRPRQPENRLQHPLHPDTVEQAFRQGARQRNGRDPAPAPAPASRIPLGTPTGAPLGRIENPFRTENPFRRPQPEPRFAPPRPRQQEPREQREQRAPAPQGYLAAHNVEKSFGARKVVRGASLFVRRGEAVGLLGPNGAGKTTIFYMITGLIKADGGKIELDGNDVTPLPMYQRARLGIGYLPQEASIFRGLNVEENIRSVLEVVEPDPKRRERDLDSLLEEFNITRLRKSPSIALSGGERRRVEIARALASRPSYMLLDEPFAGIDPIAVGDIQQLVRHLTYRGIGVLITDHNVRETLGLTDRAYIIYSGEVLMEGRPEDIVNNPDVRRLYLGEEFRL
jgi:lipopolysaccharide export system ATP-binding protein